MEKILYDQMDWAGIEEIVYSESSDPGRLLGAHVVKEGLLIQAFLPGARTAAVKLGKFLWRWLTKPAGLPCFLRIKGSWSHTGS